MTTPRGPPSKTRITDAALDHVPPTVTKLSLIKIKGLTPALAHKIARFPRLEEITVAGSPKSVVGPLKAAVEERGIFLLRLRRVAEARVEAFQSIYGPDIGAP